MAMVDGRPRSASVSALRDCKLRFISRASFEAVALKNPEVYKHLLNLVATRLRDTDQVVAAGSFLPVKGRVARALLDLAKAFGNDVGGGRVVIEVMAPCTLAVRDSGQGVTPEQLATLRERHVRHSSDRAGYGLGISIVGTIVEKHGGRLELSSPPPGAAHGFEARIVLQQA